MKEFEDRVAVITGAASGIGYGLAERCAREGMKVVLAGINLDNLLRAEAQLKPIGATTLCVQADVSKRDDIEVLAQETLDAFGGVHLLVNNAGVVAGSSAWESTVADWEWVLGVNLWGIIYALQVFVPIMLAQDTECHIVNTSSTAGLLPYHPSAPYQVTKHAVVALTENLRHALTPLKAKIGVSVLCPGWVKTGILHSGRNRPPELKNDPTDTPVSLTSRAIRENFRLAVEAGMSPATVADHVLKGIKKEQLFILTHSDWNDTIQERTRVILGLPRTG